MKKKRKKFGKKKRGTKSLKGGKEKVWGEGDKGGTYHLVQKISKGGG